MKRTHGALLALVGLVALGGCSGPATPKATAASPTSSTSATSPSASATTSAPSPTSSTSSPYDDAIVVCTESIAAPDALISQAMKDARNGTRTPGEIADSFRQAQNSVQALGQQSKDAYPNLADALSKYADALGAMRVSGAGGLDALTETRSAINAACYAPDLPVAAGS